MDSYREHPSEFEVQAALDEETVGAGSVSGEIGTDERRMHVRAYNYWVSLLHGRDYPSIEDLDPGSIADFSPNSVLLDFTSGGEDPATPYIGAAIREECGIGSEVRSIAGVPGRSLLSRLTDHYLQIIANRAPVGFEAEFNNQRGDEICYRGILMPFSSDGDTIDFIYGVINWKRAGQAAPKPDAIVTAQVERLPHAPAQEAVTAGALDDAAVQPVDGRVHSSWQDGPLAQAEPDEDPVISLDESAGLADRLWAARETAEAVKAADGRSRAALYRALSMAYDFALAALAEPQDYAELLEESCVKAQARAPMTPIVKLVFGVDYDKARLTEFAAALAHAQRCEVGLGGFLDLIEATAGGLKALVAAERQARRPQPKPDTRGEAARARLRKAAPIALATVSSETEFTLVLARRAAEGGMEAVALVEDEAMVKRAIRRVAG